jgi:hypothetical protein
MEPTLRMLLFLPAYKCEIGAADLYESWFTYRDDLDDYEAQDDHQ